MCFHLKITKEQKKLEERFKAVYIAPEQYKMYNHFNGWEAKNLYIITQNDPESIQTASWGLLPSNYPISERKNFLIKTNTLNATRERLFESHFFQEFITHQKCLILADGFYEPHKVSGVKGSIPYLCYQPDHQLFAFAGIYSEIESIDGPELSATIITTEANPFFKEIHNSPNKLGSYRMPLVLDSKHEYDWIWATQESMIQNLLDSFTSAKFKAHTVSKDVFSSKINSDRIDITKEVFYPELNTLF